MGGDAIDSGVGGRFLDLDAFDGTRRGFLETGVGVVKGVVTGARDVDLVAGRRLGLALMSRDSESASWKSVASDEASDADAMTAALPGRVIWPRLPGPTWLRL